MNKVRLHAAMRVLMGAAVLSTLLGAQEAWGVATKSRLKGLKDFTIPTSPATVGKPFSYTFHFQTATPPSVDCPPMHLSNPAGVPPGLQLVGTGITGFGTITLQGTPATSGPFSISFTANAQDPQGNCGTPTPFVAKLDVQPVPAGQVAPVVTVPQATVAVTAPTQQLANIQQRLDNLRIMRNPTVVQGLTVSYGGQSLPLELLASSAKDKEKDKYFTNPQRGGGASPDEAAFEKWGVFVQGALDVGKLDAVSTNPGFDVRTKGVTIGVDRRFSGNHVLGAALGFVKANTDLTSDAGNQDTKGWSISAFGEYVPVEKAYIDLALTYGQNRYEGTRRDTSSPALFEYRSNPHGKQFGAALSAGYEFYQQSWTINPYARVEYVNASIDAFTEEPVNGAPNPLVVSEQRYKTTVLTAGGQVQYAWSQKWGVLVPYLRLEFQYAAQTSANQITSQYVGIVGTQPVPPSSTDKSSGNIAVGATAAVGKGLSGYFNYQYLFGKENFKDSSYTLGLRYEF